MKTIALTIILGIALLGVGKVFAVGEKKISVQIIYFDTYWSGAESPYEVTDFAYANERMFEETGRNAVTLSVKVLAIPRRQCLSVMVMNTLCGEEIPVDVARKLSEKAKAYLDESRVARNTKTEKQVTLSNSLGGTGAKNSCGNE
jgi:hypothetical protein